MIYKNFIQI